MNDENGISTVSNNKFTMPFENVTIEAKWVREPIIETMKNLIENPNTGDKLIVISVIIMLISLYVGIYLSRKKEFRKII